MIVILTYTLGFFLNVLGSENMVHDEYVKLIDKLTRRIEHLENDIKGAIKREVDMAVDEKMVRVTPGEFISRDVGEQVLSVGGRRIVTNAQYQPMA